MAFPTQFTAISSTTSAAATGTAISLGAIATKWAVQVVTTSQPAPTLGFMSSCDGTNYVPVSPANTRGGWITFDTPAEYVTVQMADNTGTTAVFIVGLSD
jgi:hypothetical protein